MSGLTFFLGYEPFTFWPSEMVLRELIQPQLFLHIYPCHMVSEEQHAMYFEGKKSLFLKEYSKADVEDLVVETIVFPAYQYTSYPVYDGTTLVYRIYRR